MTLEGKTTAIDESMKSADMSASMVARETAPKRTWFLKKPNGEVFAVDEKQASELLYNPQKVLVNKRWRHIDYEVVGVSDGKTYNKVVKESGSKAAVVQAEIDALMRDQNRYRKTEERMMFEDLVDLHDTNPDTLEARTKLKKVKSIIADYDKKLDDKQDELRKLTSEVAKTAFAAELEVAMGNIVMPENHNIITPGASPGERAKIIKAMNQ